MSEQARGLIGYELEVGPLVCVNCDIYPPGSKELREGDVAPEVECDCCGEPFANVLPIGAS